MKKKETRVFFTVSQVFFNLTLIHKLFPFPKFSDLFSPKAIKLHGTVMTVITVITF